MTEPVVSIIIPCFRQAHFLTGAVSCAISQSYASAEVIVVNDGSDDDTDDVIAPFADRVHYVRQENTGLPGARNAGIAAARGKYLQFLDADDLLHPDAIAWLVEAADGREDRLVVMGHRLFEHFPEEADSKEHMPGEHRTALPGLIHSNYGPPHGYLAPRSRIMALGGFAPLKSCEDWDLWLRLALTGATLVPVQKVGAYYRQYSGSMSTNLRRMVECRAQVLLRAHREIIPQTDLVGSLGEDLLVAEYDTLRRLIAQRASRSLIRDTYAALRHLQRLGFRTSRSRLRRMADRCLGRHGESLAVRYMRWFEPDRYWDYRHRIKPKFTPA